MPRVEIHEAAQQALEDLLYDIATAAASLTVAADFVGRIEKQFQTLAEFPKMGSPRLDLGPEIRIWPVDRHIIFYRQIPGGVRIVHVRSAYQHTTSEDIP